MNAAELILQIKQLYRTKQPLNINRVRESHPELLKAAYSFSPFLGWRQALEKADLSYGDVISEIEEWLECPYCSLHYKGLSSHLSMIHGVSTDDFRKEFPSRPMMAETTRRIRTLDHPILPHWEEVWSKEYILDRTWQWYLSYGSCNAVFICENDPCLLSAAVPQYFRGWDDVIQGLCLDPSEIRLTRPLVAVFPDPESILEAIRKHYTSGNPLSSTAIQAEFPHLNSGARKYFSGWPEAVKAAGLEKQHKQEGHLNRLTLPPMQYPEKKHVIAALRKRHNQGLSLSCGVVMKEDVELTRCFRYHFKHWEDGIRAAGLVKAHKKDVRNAHGNRGAYPTENSVLEAIRQLKNEGFSLSSSSVKNSHGALLAQAYSKFGSWRKARKLAGISNEDLTRATQARNQKQLNKSAIIKKLQQRHRQGLSLLNSKVGEDDPHLRNRVQTLFNSWAEAIKAADLTKAHRKQVDCARKNAGQKSRINTYPTKKSVVSALKERLQEGKSILGKIIGKDDPDLLYTMKRDFGNVIKAIQYAGLKKQYDKQHKAVHHNRVKYPTPEDVLEAVRKRVASGQCIMSNSIHTDDASLYQKSLLWFGTWLNTCQEAGVDEVYQQTIRERSQLR